MQSEVTAKGLLGVHIPEPLSVWSWNLEDPLEEGERKIAAAMLHYGLTAEDIGDRLFMDSGRDQRLVMAEMTRNGATIVRPVVDSLVAELNRRKIDILKIDPFVSSHTVPENDNGAMDMIVKEWGRVAEQTFEGRRENLAQANKLFRTYATLIEALNRHRGKGQQKVTVEHVHVHEGGQAIIGNVEGGGGCNKLEDQPHALEHTPGEALRSQDTEREALPVACDAERPLPDARGTVSGGA